jgi:hypothetical protein
LKNDTGATIMKEATRGRKLNLFSVADWAKGWVQSFCRGLQSGFQNSALLAQFLPLALFASREDKRPPTFQQWLSTCYPVIAVAPSHSRAYQEQLCQELRGEYLAYLARSEEPTKPLV